MRDRPVTLELACYIFSAIFATGLLFRVLRPLGFFLFVLHFSLSVRASVAGSPPADTDVWSTLDFSVFVIGGACRTNAKKRRHSQPLCGTGFLGVGS